MNIRTRNAPLSSASVRASHGLIDSSHQANAQIATNGTTVQVNSRMLRKRIGSRYRARIRVHSEGCNSMDSFRADRSRVRQACVRSDSCRSSTLGLRLGLGFLAGAIGFGLRLFGSDSASLSRRALRSRAVFWRRFSVSSSMISCARRVVLSNSVSARGTEGLKSVSLDGFILSASPWWDWVSTLPLAECFRRSCAEVRVAHQPSLVKPPSRLCS